MYLFDTNVLSETIKRKPNPNLMQRLEEVGSEPQFTSSICVMELRYGSRRRTDHDSFWKRLEAELLSRVEVVDITTDIAILAGDIAAILSKKGIGVSAEDLLIGATALASELTLITANVKHFEKIPGLKVENWIRYRSNGQ
jgi:tRNA(fMet)-specific endonuclease VapC